MAKAAPTQDIATAQSPDTGPPTDQNRLALAEAQCRLGHLRAGLAAMRDGTAFPALPAQRRAEQIAELAVDLEGWEARHSALRRAVPDPDAVTSGDGSTPPQRRERHRQLYLQQRQQRRADLQTKLAYLGSVVGDRTAPREVRRRARDRRRSVELDLQVLDGEPADADLRPQDLCPDGVHLAARHGYLHTTTHPAWPCAAWPGQQRIWEKVGVILDRVAATRQDHELTRWELTLHCGHVVERRTHRSYPTYAAASGIERPRETCGVDPSFVVTERSLGPAGEPPAPPTPSRPPSAERVRMTKRVQRLEAELSELRTRLQETP